MTYKIGDIVYCESKLNGYSVENTAKFICEIKDIEIGQFNIIYGIKILVVIEYDYRHDIIYENEVKKKFRNKAEILAWLI